MAYTLLIASVLILVRGTTKLLSAERRPGVPWATLALWALLFACTLAAWMKFA